MLFGYVSLMVLDKICAQNEPVYQKGPTDFVSVTVQLLLFKLGPSFASSYHLEQ